MVHAFTRWCLLVCLTGGTAARAEVSLVDAAGTPSYRFSGLIEASPEVLGQGEVRLVFDHQDERNHYYLAVTASGARLYRVRDGEPTAIGVAGQLYRPDPTAPIAFSVQRREWQIACFLNRVTAARAEDRALPPGAVGWTATGPAIKVTEAAWQPTDEVYFADDFMRTDEQLGGWIGLTGGWENNQQGSKTSRSANAFSFRSVGGTESLAVVGYPFWTEYVAQAAVQCDTAGAIGLAVGVADETDHLRLVWTSRDHPDGGTCRLQRVFAGEVTDLTPAVPGGFLPNVWYQLQVALAGGRLLAWIDDNPMFDVAVQTCGEGRVGLYTAPGPGADDGALFDDVVVRSWPLFTDSFTTPSSDRWRPVSGDWRLTSGSAGSATVTGAGVLLTGAPEWSELAFAADCRLTGPSGVVGLAVLTDEDGSGGYEARFSPVGGQLVKRPSGNQPETVLDTCPTGLTVNDWGRVDLAVDRGLIRARLDGRSVLEGFDLDHEAGCAALVAAGPGEAAFDNVTAQFRPTFWRPPVSLPSDFVIDRYMTAWAAPGAAWVAVEGAPGRWHKGFFYGDREIRFSLPGVGRQTGSAEILLGAASASAAGASEAWLLHLELTAGERPLRLQLRRGDQVLAEARPESPPPTPELLLELRGRFILVWLDGECVLRQAVPGEQP